MGLLWTEDGAQKVSLAARSLIGRGPECVVQLSDPRASGSHALLSWRAGGWTLRELGSRNGTLLDGAPVKPGAPVAVSEGAALQFGGRTVWRLRSAAAPGAVAVCGERVVSATQELLALPSEDDPLVVIYEDGDGGFTIERDGGSGPCVGPVRVAGEDWQILLPPRAVGSALATTWDLSAHNSIEAVGLTLAVSQDEEHIDAFVRIGAARQPLTPRVHHHLLLLLARARLSDVRAGAHRGEQGWVYADELCRQLRLRPGTLNLHMLRARRQLAAAGVVGVGRLFERRRLSGQVRLQLSDVEVRAADTA